MRTLSQPTERASSASARPDAKRPCVAKSKPPVGGLKLERVFDHAAVGGRARPLAEEQQLALAGHGHHSKAGLEFVAMPDHIGATDPGLVVEDDAARLEIAGVLFGQFLRGR